MMHTSAPLLALAAAVLGALGATPAASETLLVVRKSAHALDFFDPGSGLKLASVETGHAPHEVAVSPNGRLAMVSNYGTEAEPGHSLSLIDLAQAREIRRIDLADHRRPHGLHWFAPDGVAVTTEGSGHLLVVEPQSGRIVQAIATAQLTSHMVVVSRDHTRAYVTNMGSGSTSVLDLVQGRKLADLPTGAGSEGLALVRDGQELWVGVRGENRITIVDTATLGIVASIEVPGMPIRLAASADGRTLLVTSAISGELSVIDVATRTRVQRQSLGMAPDGGLPVGLAAAADGRAIYVAATRADVVLVLDPASMRVVQRIEAGGTPDGLGLTDVPPKADCHACTDRR